MNTICFTLFHAFDKFGLGLKWKFLFRIFAKICLRVSRKKLTNSYEKNESFRENFRENEYFRENYAESGNAVFQEANEV
jgi:hypothetical protein